MSLTNWGFCDLISTSTQLEGYVAAHFVLLNHTKGLAKRQLPDQVSRHHGEPFEDVSLAVDLKIPANLIGGLPYNIDHSRLPVMDGCPRCCLEKQLASGGRLPRITDAEHSACLVIGLGWRLVLIPWRLDKRAADFVDLTVAVEVCDSNLIRSDAYKRTWFAFLADMEP
jgi:hypothetical protein